MAESPPVGSSSLNAELLDLKRSKKRKSERSVKDDGVPQDVARKRSRQEKKEVKRLKRLASNGEEGSVTGVRPPDENPAVDARARGTQGGNGPGKGVSIYQTYKEDVALTTLPQPRIDEYLRVHGITIRNFTEGALHPLRPIIEFSYLPLSLVGDRSAFTAFKSPTPIQAVAWPYLFSGEDVIGVAETGSGKTLAFGVPLICSLNTKQLSSSKSRVRAVVVSPTRELALQIHDQFESLMSSSGLKSVCVYGGVPKDDQRRALGIADILVATPGRLNDFIEEGSTTLENVQYLVLDEADRMLDRGFEDAIRQIISSCPESGRQTLMFTATWPPSVRELASTFMRSPVQISIGTDNPNGELRANKSITQLVEVLDPVQKQRRLTELLREHQQIRKGSGESRSRILIFALYKKEASRIESFLRSRGFTVNAIHGDMSQNARTASLEAFKSGICPLLVATDVAARGLDIPAVQVVINLTFPLTVEDYVHRIGRTGRAGKTGLAVTLFTEHDKALAGALINVLKAAGQDVPEQLLRFGTTVKKKGHEAYGAFYKDVGEGEKKTGTKIRF